MKPKTLGKRIIGRTHAGPYMTRYEFNCPWFGIYIHRFDGPDAPIYHDHPWNFWSFVLWGGYTERRRMTTYGTRYRCWEENRGWLSFARRHATDYHYISRLHKTPTWTLVIRWRYKQNWGFIDPKTNRWVRHDQFDEASIGFV